MSQANANARALVESLIEQSESLRVEPHVFSNGTTVIDAGCNCPGSFEAGLITAKICMAGLATIELLMSNKISTWPLEVQVSTSQPLLACLGCQYAGWNLSVETGGKTYHAMASGPGRLKCAREDIIKKFKFTDSSECAVFVLESDTLPPVELAESIASQCKLSGENIHMVITPTGSLAGSVQIASRVVEVALHKAHEIKFPVDRIVEGFGTAPVPPPIDDFMIAMGRTNDTMLYAGKVHLFVDTDAEAAEQLAKKLPSSNSPDYGRQFADIFKHYDYDFFKVDPELFSPAQVTVSSISSGKSFTSGSINAPLLEKSFELL